MLTKVKWAGVGMFVALGLLIALGAVLNATTEPATDVEQVQVTIPPTPIPSTPVKLPEAAPTPVVEWTAADLIKCDATTLFQQMRGESPPSKELLSDCEVALFTAQVETLDLMENQLTDAERAIMERYRAQLDQIYEAQARANEDGVITEAESEYLCEVAPQQAEQMSEALDYARELNLLGLEVDFLRSVLHLAKVEVG